MGNLTFAAAEPTHPRVYFKGGDIAGYKTRAADANGWGFYWHSLQSDAVSSINGMVIWVHGYGVTDLIPSYVQQYYYDLWMLRIILAGYVENDATHTVTSGLHSWTTTLRRAVVDWALKWCGTFGAYPAYLSYTGGVAGLRARAMMMGIIFDCTYDITTAGEKKILGEMAWRWASQAITSAGTMPINELIDGWGTGTLASSMCPLLALYGEVSGVYDFTAGTYDASVPLGKVLDFFWGGNAAVTSDRAGVGTGNARLEAERFWCSQGGSYKGPYYCEAHHGLQFFIFRWLRNALTGIQLGGTSYDPWADETWMPKMRDWACHLLVRGDGDFVKIGDSWRGSDPVFGPWLRSYIGNLHSVQTSAAGRAAMMWAYRYWNAIAVSKGQMDSLYWQLSFLMHDIDPAVEPIGTPSGTVPLTQFYDPPGIFLSRQSWDYPNNCWFLVNFPGWYYLGHQDLDRGQMQCYLDGSMVLCDSGMYQTESGSTIPNTAYDYEHSNFWRKQSISKSGIVLVDDGTVAPHRTYNQDPEIGTPGNKFSYPSGLGGQYFKELSDGGTDYLDPMTVENARADGGGLAWRAAEGTDPLTSGEVLGSDAGVYVVSTSLRRAFLKLHTDYAGGAERVRLYDVKWMRIANIEPLGLPAMFMLARVQSRLATMTKRMVWNFWDISSITTVGDGVRIIGRGYYPQTPTPPYQRLVSVETYGPTYWNVTTVGGGVGADSPQGPHDFEYNGVNRAPRNENNTLLGIGARHLNDLHRIRAEVSPKVAATEDYFPVLIMPHRSTQTLPAVRWINETNWVGVEIDGKVYKLHKTAKQYVSPLGAPDTEAPPAPTNLASTTPESQTVGLTWDPVVVSDLNKYKVYYRVKV